jgi:hypothetical protein
MGLRMDSCESDIRSNTPHAVEILAASPQRKSKMGSLGHLFDAFFQKEKKTSDIDDIQDRKSLGHYGSILFDFEFQSSQSNSNKVVGTDSAVKEAEEKVIPGHDSSVQIRKEVTRRETQRKSGGKTDSHSNDLEDDDRWMNFSQRPTTTQPVAIPKSTHYHTHNFERIEAIYI